MIEFIAQKIVKLADTDLPRIGQLIGVGEDEIHAFLDVETRGGGFDDKGRPKMLFEPHKFYQNLSGAERAAAVKAGLAYKNWGEKPYPRDSYPRLIQAIQINESAALRSASWGLGQVLGSNFVAAGYNSCHEMVTDFINGGEPAQLQAAVNFIKRNHLDDELRVHNWAGFARGYNGPQYARNQYHTKLASAYRKWAAIRDTPYGQNVAQTLQEALFTNPDPSVPPVVLPDPLTPSPITVKVAFARFLESVRDNL